MNPAAVLIVLALVAIVAAVLYGRPAAAPGGPCPAVPCAPPLVCAGGRCVALPPPQGPCPAFPCAPPLVCVGGRCVGPPPQGPCQGGVDLTAAQPANSVQIVNNTTESPFHVFLEYANFNPDGRGNPTLSPPPAPWALLAKSAGVTLGAPVSYYPPANPPPRAVPPFVPPNAIGSGTWQELVMQNRGDTAVVQIPAFAAGQPWSVRPLKYHAPAAPCGGAEGDCGMPILIESGKDMVGDMSAVDGVNFLLCYEFTTKRGASVINFKTNPCRAAGRNVRGCTNPAVDGEFDPALVKAGCLPAGGPHCWLSPPCPAGTCNLAGASRAWCDAVHDGQCANSSSQWSDQQRGTGGPTSCANFNLYTTYCYSHDDATSSPYFGAPYKMKLVYGDLV